MIRELSSVKVQGVSDGRRERLAGTLVPPGSSSSQDRRQHNSLRLAQLTGSKSSASRPAG